MGMENPESQPNDVPASLVAESASQSKSVSRMRIAHLLGWTFSSAIFLTMWQGLRSLEGEPQGSFSGIMDVAGVLYGVLVGAVLTGSAVLIAARIHQGPPLCWQPGHWMVAILALAYVLNLAAWALGTITVSYKGEPAFLLYGAIVLVEAFFYALACRRNVLKRWKWFFALISILLVGQGLAWVGFSTNVIDIWIWTFHSVILPFKGIVLSVWLLVLVCLDRREKLDRDWIHWTGVATYWGTYLLNVGWEIAVSYF